MKDIIGYKGKYRYIPNSILLSDTKNYKLVDFEQVDLAVDAILKSITKLTTVRLLTDWCMEEQNPQLAAFL
jgi:hypothetical protein